jgi:hypothetical protein
VKPNWVNMHSHLTECIPYHKLAHTRSNTHTSVQCIQERQYQQNLRYYRPIAVVGIQRIIVNHLNQNLRQSLGEGRVGT